MNSAHLCPCGHLRANHGRHDDHRAVTGCDGPPCEAVTCIRCGTNYGHTPECAAATRADLGLQADSDLHADGNRR